MPFSPSRQRPHRQRPTSGPATRARDFFDNYTKDLKAGDLQRLFTRDAREAYEFFARGIDRTGVEKMRWHWRLWSHVRLFFMAFTMRLSPARRMLYAVALVFSIAGLINLFTGVGFYRLAGDRVLVPIPLPLWQNGTIALALGFVLLNLLVMLEVADRLSLKHDLNVARDIQLAMLPQGTYRAPGVEVHGETRPANTVGGDFYDLIPLTDGRLVFALGDVAGKGSPAALLMALLLAILRTLVDEGLEPGPLLERLNAQVLRHAPRSRFVTLFFAVYSPDGRLAWVNAGQNPPRLRRADGRIEELHASGMALGMFEGSTYAAQLTVLQPGDLLVAYSDGITEAEHGTTGQPFDESGLDAVLAAWAAASTPEVSRAIIDGVTAHVGEARFADDLTVMVLKRM
jgi:sigma-B regulation protein RsbU (phosphoserine phosphatase)